MTIQTCACCNYDCHTDAAVALKRVAELEAQCQKQREYIDSHLLIKNAENLQLFLKEFDRRTNPANAEPDMTEFGQTVALMCLMMHKHRREALALHLGNTELIAALMGMMGQYCEDTDGKIQHMCMSAGEDAEDVLIRAGFIKDSKLDWKALEERQKKEATDAPKA